MQRLIKKIKIGSTIVFLILGCIFIWQLLSANISTIDDFQVFMSRYGIKGPIILTFIQALQVVVPILPGYLGCAVGALSYGPVVGFICNYIGISLGSIIAFYLAYHFGTRIVIEM